MHRLFLPGPLSGASVGLNPQARRHVRALRLREGEEVAAFDGEGGQWRARLLPGDRLELLDFDPVERELEREVELAVGMPANERMDWLVEKATELGARAIAPLMSARCVLRLEGERAQRRLAHWRGVAIAACEQCGRNRVPSLREVGTLQSWLSGLPPAAGQARCLLAAPRGDAAASRVQPLALWAAALEPGQSVLALSGPEGGLDEAEIDSALRAGFVPVSLGPRTLRAETAPLALLAALAASAGRPA
jgi:16S rRNA (uracil1498-N3)-methyltransferase